MHWHGISMALQFPCSVDLMGCIVGQYGSPFSDGTPQASQWPIPPGKYFDYEFKFDLNVSGTLYVL